MEHAVIGKYPRLGGVMCLEEKQSNTKKFPMTACQEFASYLLCAAQQLVIISSSLTLFYL